MAEQPEAPTLPPAPVETPDADSQTDERQALDAGFLVICWNDPVNLMDYVTHVFQQVFGWNLQKAEHHMLEVHTQGKSVLIQATQERAEHFVHQLHAYGLHATMEPSA